MKIISLILSLDIDKRAQRLHLVATFSELAPMISNFANKQAALETFSLENEENYCRWRDQKIDSYPGSASELIVEIKDPKALSKSEKNKLLSVCQKTNMVIYHTTSALADKDLPRLLGKQVGLNNLDPNMLADDDGITSLELMPGKQKRGYIPYSDKRLLWHTDGYYNDPEHQILAMLLHCVRPARSGGVNKLFDHEMAYLLLREQNPQYIESLMADDAFTIPENLESNEVSRPARTGPVFLVNKKTGKLSMRYTARTRSIEWKDNDRTRKAVNALAELLDSDCKSIFNHRLETGQGIICNNVLHNRTSFENGETISEQRLIYRARYYDQVTHIAS